MYVQDNFSLEVPSWNRQESLWKRGDTNPEAGIRDRDRGARGPGEIKVLWRKKAKLTWLQERVQDKFNTNEISSPSLI